MATTAKKFVKVTGLDQVFATGYSGAGNWHGYNISQIKTGVTSADSNSILFIEDSVWGKWIWAQGRMYSGNDINDFNIGSTGDMWIGATTTRDDVGNITTYISHQGASASYGTTGASAAASGSNYTFDAVTEIGSDERGHINSVTTTTFTIPVAGVTGDAKVKVGASGTQYYITHETAASGTFTSSKTAASNEVTVTNPVLTFDETGHLTSTGSTSYKITAADLGVDGVLHFLGVTTTALEDGSTTNPIIINGSSVTAQKGDIVLYGSKEFVWDGTQWEELGDESKYLLGATGDSWISATVQNGIVQISHKAAPTGAAGEQTVTGIIGKINYDANGHIISVGVTGAANSKLYVAGSNNNVYIGMTGEDSGTVNIGVTAGVSIMGPTPGGGGFTISQTDTVTAATLTGETYKIADYVIGGVTGKLYGKDTTYVIGSSVATGTSGANVTIINKPGSSYGATSTTTINIISPDDSIKVGVSGTNIVIDYTGVSTPEDWAVIPESV